MAYAISSQTRGTYLGDIADIHIFSKIDTACQFCATTQEKLCDAQRLKRDLATAMPTLTDLSIVEVRSGHWRDLAAAGLHTGDMQSNEEFLREPVPA